MQIIVSADNLSAPARSDHALHGMPPRRELSSRGRFVCGTASAGAPRYDRTGGVTNDIQTVREDGTKEW